MTPLVIGNIESERAPLIRNYIRGLPSLYTESVHNFYSPLVTPDGSLYRYDHQQRNVPTARFSREEASIELICVLF